MTHIGEDDLECHHMRTLPEAEVAPLEEHLLTCPECRDRLDKTGRYVAAIQAAASEIRKRGE